MSRRERSSAYLSSAPEVAEAAAVPEVAEVAAVPEVAEAAAALEVAEVAAALEVAASHVETSPGGVAARRDAVQPPRGRIRQWGVR